MELEPKSPNKFQYLPNDTDTPLQEDTTAYAEPSPEYIKVMEKRLDQLAQLMNGTDVPYWLDGGINVSLLNGRFIRPHKDVDISVFEEDLDTLEKALREKGYAIATNALGKNTSETYCIELVSAREIQARTIRDLQIVQLDDNGRVRPGLDDLNFIDLHLNGLSLNGDSVSLYSGVTLPSRYFTDRKNYRTTSGYEVPITKPLIVAYYKVEIGRDSDFKDISHIQQFLSPEDKVILVQLFEKMPQRKIEALLPFLESVFSVLNTKMDEQAISTHLLQYPAFRSLPERSEYGQKFLNDFPKYYLAHPDMSTTACIDYLFRVTLVREQLQSEADKKIAQLKSALNIE